MHQDISRFIFQLSFLFFCCCCCFAYFLLFLKCELGKTLCNLCYLSPDMQMFFGINSCWKNTKTFGETLRWELLLPPLDILTNFLQCEEKNISINTPGCVCVTFVPITRVTATVWQLHSCSPLSLLYWCYFSDRTVLHLSGMSWYILYRAGLFCQNIPPSALGENINIESKAESFMRK